MMSKTQAVKPMLAIDYQKITKPLKPEDYLYQVKLDGIRMLVKGGVCYSRTGKPIPNEHIQERYSKFEGYDGELYAEGLTFRQIQSIVMAKSSPLGNLRYYVFDLHDNDTATFDERYNKLLETHWRDTDENYEIIRVVYAHDVYSVEGFDTITEQNVLLGYEGAIFRHKHSLYKHGRSGKSVKHGTPELICYKLFVDDEAVILSIEPREEFIGETTVSPLGYSERDSKKENKRHLEEVDSFICQNSKGQIFDVQGFSAEDRIDFWNRRADLLGKTITYKYFPTEGYDKPRFPTFKSFRAGF